MMCYKVAKVHLSVPHYITLHPDSLGTCSNLVRGNIFSFFHTLKNITAFLETTGVDTHIAVVLPGTKRNSQTTRDEGQRLTCTGNATCITRLAACYQSLRLLQRKSRFPAHFLD